MTLLGEDTCYHVTPPGQRMCGCADYLEWMRAVVVMQGERIRDLAAQGRKGQR